MPSYSSVDDEYDSDEPPELDLNIPNLIQRASAALSTPCTRAVKLTRGANHEVFILHFKPDDGAHPSLAKSGYKCVGRFSRCAQEQGKITSEIETIQYIKKHTNIPVAEIFYHDIDAANDTGAPFVLMEKLPGRHLNKLWDDLCLDSKKAVLTQIASVLAEFASLKFDRIGSLQKDGVGPLFHPCLKHPMGPFSSTEEYLSIFVSEKDIESGRLKELYRQIRIEIESFCSLHGNTSFLQSPYSLIHFDFDGQNMLFTQPERDVAPKLSGVIDFEYAYTGPLYFLYEYPILIQDVSWSKHLYEENLVLRTHFVRALYTHLPRPSRATMIKCMKSKNFTLNDFQRVFMSFESTELEMVDRSATYLESLKAGNGVAYSGCPDYQADAVDIPPRTIKYYIRRFFQHVFANRLQIPMNSR